MSDDTLPGPLFGAANDNEAEEPAREAMVRDPRATPANGIDAGEFADWIDSCDGVGRAAVVSVAHELAGELRANLTKPKRGRG